MDMPDAQANLPRITDYFGKRLIFPISAITAEGVGSVIRTTYQRLHQINQEGSEERKVLAGQATAYSSKPRGRFELAKDRDCFVVLGDEPRRAVQMTDMGNDQALILLHRKLKKMGLMNALNKAGIKEGDTIQVDEFEFTYSTHGIDAG